MYDYGATEEQKPVMWVRGYPVYGAYFLVAVFAASMVATAILMAAGSSAMFEWLPFTNTAVLGGQAWRVLTYGLVNPPSLAFVIDMAVLYWFGREVEKFLGRGKFGLLFAGIYLLPPVLLVLVGLRFPTMLLGESCAFAIFVAFAAMYPNVAVFFGVLAKWVAAVLFAVYTLIDVSHRDWQSGLVLWATSVFALAFVRHQQGFLHLPSLSVLRRKPALRMIPGGADRPAAPAASRADSMAEVDALLDKIARSGFASLTAKEKARLDSARDELSRRGSRR